MSFLHAFLSLSLLFFKPNMNITSNEGFFMECEKCLLSNSEVWNRVQFHPLFHKVLCYLIRSIIPSLFWGLKTLMWLYVGKIEIWCFLSINVGLINDFQARPCILIRFRSRAWSVAIELIYIVNLRSGGKALITVAAAISSMQLLPSERTIPPPLKQGMWEVVVIFMPYPEFLYFFFVSVDPSVDATMCWLGVVFCCRIWDRFLILSGMSDLSSPFSVPTG